MRLRMSAIHSDYVDILTFYYVEEAEEWDQLIARAGAWKCAGRLGATAECAGWESPRISGRWPQRPLAAASSTCS